MQLPLTATLLCSTSKSAQQRLARGYLWELLFLQILRHRWLKVHGVALVQAVNLPPFVDLHVAVDQDELAERLVRRTEERKYNTLTRALILFTSAQKK